MEPVSSRLDSGVAWIEFGDPARRNVLTPPLLEALPLALAEAEARGARVAVLRGRGDIWSAGYDIGQIPPQLFEADLARIADHPFERCMRAVEDCRIPTIAALHGHAFGGAVELAVSCDIRIAQTGIRIGSPAAKLGIVYSHTGLEKFLRLIGPAHTREIFFAARKLDATESERIGLVNRVVAASEFDAAVRDLAAEIAACAPLAVQGMKEVLRTLERNRPLPEADVRSILALRQRAFQSQDFKEGRAAFDEKRDPEFRGG